MDSPEIAKLLPRAYQEEIFTRAQETNIIAALDTGSGKTFIGALLIKSITALDTSNGKKVLFLVPKVPLVEQQTHFLAGQTPLRVKGYYGGMGVDQWDKNRWRREFQQADVLVMTAQIFYNIIAHAFWRMDKVSLIVFDECHHAQKNHPYNAIMTEHYRNCPPETRPKIFGMTASPIWNLKKPQESLQLLESSLCAKVIAVREHAEELNKHSPRPTEIIRIYPSTPLEHPAYISPSLWHYLEASGLLYHVFDKNLDKMRGRYFVTLNALGPYAADCFIHSYLTHKLTELLRQDHATYLTQINKSFPGYSLANVRGNNADAFFNNTVSKGVLESLQGALTHFNLHMSADTVFLDEWFSPKFHAVVDILRNRRSSVFQGILFVEQRQVAMTLAKLLARAPELKDWLRCAELMGHGGQTEGGNSFKGMGLKGQDEVVKSFREGKLNFLVATSVAEEGLDFPACELVIRFDALQHMVGYVQSRGRARHRNSTFIVMIEENNESEIARYTKYREEEPELRRIYQGTDGEDGDDTEADLDDPNDISERVSYTVPSTGAMLTYSSSISLLNHLCATIRRDKYTPVHRPKYYGDFESIVDLPSALPLPKEHLRYIGPAKRTKKEAKRAVSFEAVKALHSLGVFDDHLSPVKATKGDDVEDADGRRVPDVSDVPEYLETDVRDPWTVGPDWWLHVVYLNGRRSAGLVACNQLPQVDLQADGVRVVLSNAIPIQFDPYERLAQTELMQKFTKVGLWWCVTGRPVELPLTCCLAPLDAATDQPDWELMERAVLYPQGLYDWTGITDEHCDSLVIMNIKKHGRPLLLHRIRRDLTPQSKLNPEDCTDGVTTYAELFVQQYSSTSKPLLPLRGGPLLEVYPLPRRPSGLYTPNSLRYLYGPEVSAPDSPSALIVPQELCKWVYLSDSLTGAFRILCRLCRRITDVYRVHSAKNELGITSAEDDFLIEAFTIPSAHAGFNNQRLETLGDAVLKLCVTVHLYNRYPHKHEGQLNSLKINSVSNRALLAHAREIGLEHYITSESGKLREWRYVHNGKVSAHAEPPSVQRKIPRRSLQDCMEAALGASFLTGGIDSSLKMGTSLSLCFGGPIRWSLRYELPKPSRPGKLFRALQEALGYTFRNGELLVEAVTHPSFQSDGGACYQRLEFLGDALIDLVIAKYLFQKYPKATSGQITWARSRAVCAPALAVVAVQRLSVHKYMLANNVDLSRAIADEVPALSAVPYEVAVKEGWRFDPPKAISDLLESILGAVLVDSGYDYEVSSNVVEHVMSGLMGVLTPHLPRDPVSELMVWTARAGCRKIAFRKSQSNPAAKKNDSMSVLAHDQEIVGPITAVNLSLAKGLASAEALVILADQESDRSLSRICDCCKTRAQPVTPPLDEVMDEEALDDETEAGFALQAAIQRNQVDEELRLQNAAAAQEAMDIDEEEEVEAMVQDTSCVDDDIAMDIN
ncbi:P-loop containing nucleoside triphosphate hydrolase protein [Rickenella mellea]|uniref:P-loop containing nucleoside triphosphate hydrolase protein n=1 Tax=Rickenella mellea TaxID=50990 RepID=A0A4Y7QL75_9AGAM|nr:P-loop containing nucleoside triphosphate hydrolase protein [Rickenella mellea]